MRILDEGGREKARMFHKVDNVRQIFHEFTVAVSVEGGSVCCFGFWILDCWIDFERDEDDYL